MSASRECVWATEYVQLSSETYVNLLWMVLIGHSEYFHIWVLQEDCHYMLHLSLLQRPRRTGILAQSVLAVICVGYASKFFPGNPPFLPSSPFFNQKIFIKKYITLYTISPEPFSFGGSEVCQCRSNCARRHCYSGQN